MYEQKFYKGFRETTKTHRLTSLLVPPQLASIYPYRRKHRAKMGKIFVFDSETHTRWFTEDFTGQYAQLPGRGWVFRVEVDTGSLEHEPQCPPIWEHRYDIDWMLEFVKAFWEEKYDFDRGYPYLQYPASNTFTTDWVKLVEPVSIYAPDDEIGEHWQNPSGKQLRQIGWLK